MDEYVVLHTRIHVVLLLALAPWVSAFGVVKLMETGESLTSYNQL